MSEKNNICIQPKIKQENQQGTNGTVELIIGRKVFNIETK